jgi:hypothetical protein
VTCAENIFPQLPFLAMSMLNIGDIPASVILTAICVGTFSAFHYCGHGRKAIMQSMHSGRLFPVNKSLTIDVTKLND